MTESTSPARTVSLDETFSFALIGNYIVNAGLLEHTFALLVEWMSGNPDPRKMTFTRKLMWTDLLKRLRKECESSEDGAQILELLAEHDIDRLVAIRHGLVHGSVDVSNPPQIIIVRRERTGQGALWLGTRDTYIEQGLKLIALEQGLNAFLPVEFRRRRSISTTHDGAMS